MEREVCGYNFYFFTKWPFLQFPYLFLSQFLRRVFLCISFGLSDALARPGWNAGHVFVSVALLSPQKHLCPRSLEARLSPLHPPVFSSADVWKAGSFLSLKNQILVVSLFESSSVSPAFTLFYLVYALLYLFGSFCGGFPNS